MLTLETKKLEVNYSAARISEGECF